MSPSISTNVSLPDLDMASSDNLSPTGSTSSISSDLSTSRHRKASGVAPNDDNDRWYYYLSPNAAKLLPQYQYHGEDQSLLYKHVLSPFAKWCVHNLTPTWLAPNTITTIGLGWMVLSYCVIWYFCPGMYEANTDLDVNTYAVPGAIFLLNGCAMLIYQTMDNMDGQQARKTGSSSPLGLLFDHGCDAMNLILGSANWITAMAMIPGNVSDLLGRNDHGNIQSKSLMSEVFGGDAILATLLILSPMIAFYISTWEQYYTGTLILPPFNGPSEGLIMGASLSLISFFCGPMYWQGTTLADGAINQLGSYLGEEVTYFTFFQGRVRNMDLVILASVVALVREVALKFIFVVRNHGLQTLWTLMPNVLFVTCILAMVHLYPMIYLRSPRFFMHLISGLFTEQTTQLMLAHMVEEGYEFRNRWPLFPPLFLTVAMMAGLSVPAEHLDTLIFVYTTGLWVYLAFKIRVHIYEICDVLGIWCFDIVTPHPKRLSEPTVAGTAKKTN
ncbi:hypothetical protein ACHAXR_012470 [Thalassiosira sp. AJA248-18]